MLRYLSAFSVLNWNRRSCRCLLEGSRGQQKLKLSGPWLLRNRCMWPNTLYSLSQCSQLNTWPVSLAINLVAIALSIARCCQFNTAPQECDIIWLPHITEFQLLNVSRSMAPSNLARIIFCFSFIKLERFATVIVN